MIWIKVFTRINDLFGVLISESFGIRTFLMISEKIYFAEDEIMEYIHGIGKFSIYLLVVFVMASVRITHLCYLCV